MLLFISIMIIYVDIHHRYIDYFEFTQRIVEAWEYYLLPWLKVAAKNEFIRMKTKEENESHTLDSLYATLTNVLTTFSRNLIKLPKCKIQLLGMSSFIVQE